MTTKIALVVGSAHGMWEEVERAKQLFEVKSLENVYCVKMTGIDWPEQFKTWVTLHPEFMDRYKQEREKLNLPLPLEIVGPLKSEVGEHHKHQMDRYVSYRWPGMTASGSSGLFGIKVALDDGFDKVVVAGMPMTREAGHYRRGHHDWVQRDAFTSGWEAARPYIQNKVKSFSGWTKEFLGEPTESWLSS